jgi:glycine/D-amino acid oxidase-like deaminating enzyme
MDADVVVVGAGLAGLVGTHEMTRRGKKVAVVDQENEANLGGQAYSPAAPPAALSPTHSDTQFSGQDGLCVSTSAPAAVTWTVSRRNTAPTPSCHT